MAFTNLDAHEGTVDGSFTVQFKNVVHRVILINDSVGADLKFRINDTEVFVTLKSAEIMELDLNTKQIYIQSSSAVPYRIIGLR